MAEYIRRCEFCVNRNYDKSKIPCSECTDNGRYVSHFKPHEVYISLEEAGMIHVINYKGGNENG